MNKLVFSLILGLSLLVTGCSDNSGEKIVNNEAGSTQQPVSFDPYTNEFGQFEVTTKIEQLEVTEKADDISLTIQSIEQGKVKLTDYYAPNYEKITDDEGYVSYIKAHMKIDAPVDELPENITFYAYQASIQTNTGHSTQSDSTFSNKVSIQHNEMMQLEGDIYFILVDDKDLESITINVPAPFDKTTNLSIGDNLTFTIDLTKNNE